MEKKKITLKEIGIPRLLLMFGAGIFLLILSFPNILPFSGEEKGEIIKEATSSVKVKGDKMNANGENLQEYGKVMEENLKSILGKVAGVGKVEVMITYKSSKEKVPLKNQPYRQESTTETDSEGGSRVNSNISKEEETVVVESGDGTSGPYVVKETMPQIEGVLIIAQGGGNVNIINEIMEATMVLFDVPAHKIKVMKME